MTNNIYKPVKFYAYKSTHGLISRIQTYTEVICIHGIVWQPASLNDDFALPMVYYIQGTDTSFSF